jgi:RNA recognition motif-containing protein
MSFGEDFLGKLYVQNLPIAVDSSELECMFGNVGDVFSATVQVISDPNGDRRVGYVHMATQEQALDCIDRFNGQKKDGKVLIVREDKPHVPNPNFVSTNRTRNSGAHKKDRQ